MKSHTVKFCCVSILCLSAALLVSGCKKSDGQLAGTLNTFKRYPYERFHLVYEYGGDLRGTEELFASEFGKYEARYSKFEILTPSQIRPVEKGVITRMSDEYSFDFIEKSITHVRPTSFDSLYHLDEKDIPSPEENLKEEMKKNYFRNTGTDIVAGKLAARWESSDGGMTLWIWNSIMLRQHGASEKGIMDMTLKTIDTLWTVDTMKFAVPTGFRTKKQRRPEDAPPPN